MAERSRHRQLPPGPAARWQDLPHPDGLGTWAEDGAEVTFLLQYDTGRREPAPPDRQLAGYGHLASSLADADLACPPLLFCFPGPRREQAARRAMAACCDTLGPRIGSDGIRADNYRRTGGSHNGATSGRAGARTRSAAGTGGGTAPCGL